MTTTPPSCSSPPPLLCDACGQEAYGVDGDERRKLRRCARCQSAWYHDASCQKRHWQLHRKTCTNNDNNNKSILFRIVTTHPEEGRGNALVACQPIRKHQVIGVFEPLVPPVLNRSCRTTHCAWCLANLTIDLQSNNNSDYDSSASSTSSCCYRTLSDLSIYPVRVCSNDCARALLDQETSPIYFEMAAIQGLCQNKCGPPMYLPTALLLYRLVASAIMMTASSPATAAATANNDENETVEQKESSRSCNQKEQKQRRRRRKAMASWDDIQLLVHTTLPPTSSTGRDVGGDDDDSNNNDRGAHEEAVVRTVQAMLQYSHHLLVPSSSSPSSLLLPKQEDLRNILQRILVNACSITDSDGSSSTSSSSSIAVGIFHMAHFGNHSCVPNAAQSFRIRSGIVDDPRHHDGNNTNNDDNTNDDDDNRRKRVLLVVRQQALLPTLQLTAIESIAPNEEITINYLPQGGEEDDDEDDQRETRQKASLWRHYGFRCTCRKCGSSSSTTT